MNDSIIHRGGWPDGRKGRHIVARRDCVRLGDPPGGSQPRGKPGVRRCWGGVTAQPDCPTSKLGTKSGHDFAQLSETVEDARWSEARLRASRGVTGRAVGRRGRVGSAHRDGGAVSERLNASLLRPEDGGLSCTRIIESPLGFVAFVVVPALSSSR